MDVDQKHITTIRLHDAKGCNIEMVKDSQDYQLRLSSPTTVVNITLGLCDVRKLCQELVRLDTEESWKTPPMTAPEVRSMFFNSTPRSFNEMMANWFSRMANGDMTEKVCKR